MPDNDNLTASPEGRESLKRFRRETWWQVTFPVVMVAVLAIAAVVLVLVLGGGPAASIVADYSLMLLIMLSMVGLLVILALFVALAFGISYLIRGTPPYTGAVQDFAKRAHKWVDEQTDRIASVVILARSALAGVRVFLQQQGYMDETPGDKPGQTPSL